MSSEILFDNAANSIIPRRVYSSSFAETANYLIAACEGESELYSQLLIKRYSKTNQTWSAPELISPAFKNMPNNSLYCPALFQLPDGGPLLLFYQMDNLFYQMDNTVSRPDQLSMLRWSTDEGATWNSPVQLPLTIGGPDQSSSLRLNSAGDLIVGSVVLQNGTSTANISVAHFDYSHPETLGDLASWTSVNTLQFGNPSGPAQYIAARMSSPSVLAEGNNTFSAIGGMREAVTTSPAQFSLYQSQLTDGANSWTPLTQLSVGMGVINRFVDAITLSNPINSDSGLSSKHVILYIKRGDPNASTRQPDQSLKLGVSFGTSPNNQANNWVEISTIESIDSSLQFQRNPPPQYFFREPNLFQTKDGMLHLTYRIYPIQPQTTSSFQIKHVVIDPTKLPSTDNPGSTK